jgi:tetratricopeptide (TPR) repeat protein
MWRAFLLAALVVPTSVFGQDISSWVGKRVITHYGAVLQIGNQVVDDEKRSENLAVSGKESSQFRVYRVDQVNGNWLWLKAEKEGVQGWVKVEFVIPYDQAIDYFTNQIRANPNQSSSYIRRGNVWSEKGEYDIAIGDFNEAIRLDPSNEAAFNNRGNAWSKKKEHDKAIADYSEAIRLDPKFATAFTNRGSDWEAKKEYDKAIADYSEAIRLDPRFATAFTKRGNAWSKKKEYGKAIADYNEVIRLNPKYSDGYNGRAWLWATCRDERFRDAKKAVESATRACELSEWKAAYDLDTLAAAYAEAGNFDKAVEWETKAIQLSTDTERYQERLRLYKDNKPYRQTD